MEAYASYSEFIRRTALIEAEKIIATKGEKMINEGNLEYLIKECLGFTKKGKIYQKHYPEVNCDMRIDFDNKKLIFPSAIVGRERNDGYNKPEKFVVFECVDRLLVKGYR